MTRLDTDVANPSSALKSRWLSSIDDVSPAQWDALFAPEASVRFGNPFLRHAFLSALEASGSADSESGWKPHHLLLETDGVPTVALPLYLKDHSYGEFVFDWGWAEAWSRHGLAYYPKLLTAVPFCPSEGPRVGLGAGVAAEPAVQALWTVVTDETERHDRSSWHLLFADAASRNPWKDVAGDRLLERRDVQFHFLNPGYGTFDDFLGSLRSKRRKNVRKERRRVADQGVTLERQVGDDITDADWDAFYRCYVSTFLKRSGHGGYLTRSFFELLRERMAEQLLLVVARQEGQVVAGALFLFDGERLYGRWWGALGHVDCLHFETCFYQGIEFAIDNSLSVFDPGTQGEHKLLRGFEPVTTRSLHYIRDPRFRAAIADFLERERDHVKAYGTQAAEYLPFRRDQAAPE